MDIFNIVKLYQEDIDKSKWERTVFDASKNTRIFKKSFRLVNMRDVISDIRNTVKTINSDRNVKRMGETLDYLIISYTVRPNVSKKDILMDSLSTETHGIPDHLNKLIRGEINTSEFSRERKRKNARSVKEEDPKLWQQLIDELRIEVEFENQFKSDLRNITQLKEFLKLYPHMPRAKQIYENKKKEKMEAEGRRSKSYKIEINPDPDKVTIVTLHLANSATGAEVRNIKIVLPTQNLTHRSNYNQEVEVSIVCNRELVDSRILTPIALGSSYVNNVSMWIYTFIHEIYKKNIGALNLGESGGGK